MKDGHAVLFNADWKFLVGDPKDAYREDYPDRTWKRLDLPHDWVISRPFSRGPENGWTGQNMQGFFAWEGTAWYRKEFELPDAARKSVYIYFGGAYRNSTVFVNGTEAGGRACGYASFELDITGLVRPGKNCIAVRLDNGCEPPDRWYSGSGLYRNVYLRIVPQTHIKTWGVRITAQMAGVGAEITADVTVVNRGKAAAGAVCIRVAGPDNRTVTETRVPFNVAANAEITVGRQFSIPNPRLWSAENPNLYRAFVSLDGDAEGAVEVPLGIRRIEIAARTGMTVNGEPVKLKGVCLHHDCGILGSAWHEAAWRRRLLTLKSLGCNAIRTSHNPPAEEFLDLCDELGFYVIGECFDKWKSGYYGAHFDADWQRDLEDFILRDRNHPAVFLWSIGNEVEGQGTEEMLRIQKMLASFVRALDSRPVTCALEPHANPRSLVNAPVSQLVERTKKLAEDVDVLGLNYHEPLYGAYTAAIDRPIVGTESYDYYSCSGTNFEDVIAKNPWRFVTENDNVIGQFVWAGIEYLGESGWPAKGWAGAVLDICGFLKPSAYYRKSIWSDEPMVYLAIYDTGGKADYARGRWSFPQNASHLNFDHFRRKTVTAAVYTNCDQAELWINGKRFGRRSPADFENRIIEWTFEYAEGEVTVIGYRGGREAYSYTLKTAGAAQRILLTPDTDSLAAGGIAQVEVTITDENGIPCPNEEVLIEFGLTGDGEILGACSPDITAPLGYRLPKVITAGGKALVIIRAGASGETLELTAYAEKLRPVLVRFKSERRNAY
jgi:beta-galactosidase